MVKKAKGDKPAVTEERDVTYTSVKEAKQSLILRKLIDEILAGIRYLPKEQAEIDRKKAVFDALFPDTELAYICLAMFMQISPPEKKFENLYELHCAFLDFTNKWFRLGRKTRRSKLLALMGRTSSGKGYLLKGLVHAVKEAGLSVAEFQQFILNSKFQNKRQWDNDLNICFDWDYKIRTEHEGVFKTLSVGEPVPEHRKGKDCVGESFSVENAGFVLSVNNHIKNLGDDSSSANRLSCFLTTTKEFEARVEAQGEAGGDVREASLMELSCMFRALICCYRQLFPSFISFINNKYKDNKINNIYTIHKDITMDRGNPMTLGQNTLTPIHPDFRRMLAKYLRTLTSVPPPESLDGKQSGFALDRRLAIPWFTSDDRGSERIGENKAEDRWVSAIRHLETKGMLKKGFRSALTITVPVEEVIDYLSHLDDIHGYDDAMTFTEALAFVKEHIRFEDAPRHYTPTDKFHLTRNPAVEVFGIDWTAVREFFDEAKTHYFTDSDGVITDIFESDQDTPDNLNEANYAHNCMADFIEGVIEGFPVGGGEKNATMMFRRDIGYPLSQATIDRFFTGAPQATNWRTKLKKEAAQ